MGAPSSALSMGAAVSAGLATAAGRSGATASEEEWATTACLLLADRTLQAVGTNQRPYREKPASSSTGRMRCGDTLPLLRLIGLGCRGIDRGCSVIDGMETWSGTARG